MPRRLHPDHLGPGRSQAAEHHRAADRVRRPGEGGHGTGQLRPVQPDARNLPRSAHRIDRHRAEHDRSEHAYGRPAQAVAVARPRAAEPAGRTAADQRRAGRKGQAAGRAERRSGTEEHGSGTGPPGAGRKGQAACAHFEVQERIPGEHVARAAHAAQSLLILSDQLSQEPRRQPHRPTGGIRPDDPLLRQRSARADQRHSRPVEDRIRHGHRRCRRCHASANCRITSIAPSATWPRTRSSTSRWSWRRRFRAAMQTDAKRLQQILKNLLSNAFKFTEQRQGHAGSRPGRPKAGRRDNEALNRARSVIAFSVTRHRHRHPAREAADHLRGVPAGGRIAPAASTAARAWAWRSAAKWPSCSAAKSGCRASRAKGARSRSICRRATAAPKPTPQAVAGTVEQPLCRCSNPAGDAMPLTRRRPQERPSAVPQRTSSIDDTRQHPARRSRAADRRERHQLRPLPARDRRTSMDSRRVIAARGAAAIRHGPRLQADAITLDINLPDIDGWRVLHRLKDDPGHPAYPRADHHHRRGTRARPAHGRDGRAGQAGARPRNRSTKPSAGSRASSIRAPGSCWSSKPTKQRRAADRRADRRPRCGDHSRRHRRRRLAALEGAGIVFDLRRPRPRSARHEGLRPGR